MRTHAIPILLAGSAAYAAAAVLAHLLHFAAYPTTLRDTLVSCIGVVFPYALLWLVHRSADQRSRGLAWVSVALAALLGAIAYSDSFRARTVPDMYAITYIAVPVIQSALAIVALVVIGWRGKLPGQLQ